MCGIIGVIGRENASTLLVEGLRRLEYRGYDSAGVATLVDGQIHRRRAPGKIAALADKVAKEPLAGSVGIAHTRWAMRTRIQMAMSLWFTTALSRISKS